MLKPAPLATSWRAIQLPNKPIHKPFYRMQEIL
jgi:hypothetical protein